MPARIYVTCTIADCDRPHYGRGMCQMHYLRQYRHGSTDNPRKRGICSVSDCGRPVKARGMCEAHYMRWYSGSNQDGPITPVAGTPPLESIPPHLTREQWIIWAAGFFDGEGCISIVRAGKGMRYYLQVAAAQADIRPLKILQALFGGRLKPHSKSTKRPVFYWTTTCQQGATAIREMEPFLVVKREQAICALQFQDTIKLGKRATEELRETRETLCKQIAELKQVHYSL